ncbi:MAG TPA: ferrous iron transport protein A [Clostridiales bacterium]|nr:ferrous iron transport protein A [Clostridiales bacterium]
MQLTLKDLLPGEKGRVISIGSAGPVRRRLVDMGITPGTVILLRKLAPLGDPMEVNLRGYELSLRKNEAEQVIIEKIEG